MSFAMPSSDGFKLMRICDLTRAEKEKREMKNTDEILDWLIFTGKVKEENRDSFRPMIDRELMRGESPERLVTFFCKLEKMDSPVDVFKPIFEMLDRAIEAFSGLAHYAKTSSRTMKELDRKILEIARTSQPAALYAVMGHPYGKNTKGKKRWLREMKKETL